MDLKQIMSQEVAMVLEESANLVTNRLVMESLLKNGKVTIEEATFLNKLATEVIQEAAEDFIPDTIEVQELQEAQAPVEEVAQAPESTLEEAAAQVAQVPVEESTQTTQAQEDVVPAEVTQTPVEESTQTAQAEKQEELTESEAIVNNLINKLF